MSIAFETAAPGRVIASRSRATALAETIASKHALDMRAMLCARWDRFAIAARAELASELKDKLGWSQRRIGEYIGCTQPNVRKLFSYHNLNASRAKRWLPQADVHALLAVQADDRLARALDAEERAAEAEAELRRLSGADLALRLAEGLDLGQYMRCAIVLAIVCEAYPRIVPGADMIHWYDEACERLDYGERRGSNFNLLAKNVAKLRDHFVDRGWPVPITANDPLCSGLVGARRLDANAAAFLHERLGAPKLSQMEAAHEQRSSRVHASGAR